MVMYTLILKITNTKFRDGHTDLGKENRNIK